MFKIYESVMGFRACPGIEDRLFFNIVKDIGDR